MLASFENHRFELEPYFCGRKKLIRLRWRNINLLLTEREGRTGGILARGRGSTVERSEVRTKTTEGQYSPVRSRASEVSK